MKEIEIEILKYVYKNKEENFFKKIINYHLFNCLITINFIYFLLSKQNFHLLVAKLPNLLFTCCLVTKTHSLIAR